MSAANQNLYPAVSFKIETISPENPSLWALALFANVRHPALETS